MIYFLISTYLLIFIALRIYADFNITRNFDREYKFFKRLIQLTNIGFVLFPIFFVVFLWYGSGMSFDTHYDVKKGSWMWFMRMDNKIINNFPIIEPIKRAEYNDIGGDNPNIGAAWSVEYISNENHQELLIQIKKYLEKSNIKIYSSTEAQCWFTWNDKLDKEYFYKDMNYKKGCLELKITELENGKTDVKFYVVI